MSDILAEICAAKREHVAKRRKQASEQWLLKACESASPPRGFMAALSARIADKKTALIAEIKKASPSKGVIRADFSPAAHAQAYAEGGAACLSVLTDEPYFQGHDDYLKQARAACTLPALRKDFMLEPYQIIESRALGADAILIIMAAVSDVQAAELFHAAESLRMDALVEVHDERELDRALTRLPARLIGINNRDLKSFKTDLSTSERLAKRVPQDILLVAESGINTHADVERLAAAGIHALLVGESLMREADITAATRRLLGTEGTGI